MSQPPGPDGGLMSLPDNDFPAFPYPGARPRCSFVHLDGVGWPVRTVPGTAWRWELAGTGVDLDDWLAERGAPPLAARIPVLAYGSNACPSKVTWLRERLGLAGPVVVLRAECRGLAAVWAAGLRVVDTQRPATLTAEPGRVEWHAVWLATADQVRVLDVCEGRAAGRYRLARLGSDVSVAVDGLALPGVLAYTGATEQRAPLLVAGVAVRCADVTQGDAVDLVGVPGADGLAVTTVDGDPHADEWPAALFVYGTLRPGAAAWDRLRPHVIGEPVPTAVRGDLVDTGFGYPALCAGDGVTPGWTVALRSPATVLPELDEYEGTEYRRVRAVDSGGRLCWTYLWTAPTDGMPLLPDGWAG